MTGEIKFTNKSARELLNVAPDASDEDIKRQYRKLALHCHPDKNHSPDAEEKFKVIKAAYEYLLKPDNTFEEDSSTSEGEEMDFASAFCCGDSFFKQQQPTYSYYKNGFSVKQAEHIFINHPKFEAMEMVFWLNQHSLSLPVHFDPLLRLKIKCSLIPIIPSDFYWLGDNPKEIVLKLPTETDLLKRILNIIFQFYEFSEDLIQFIYETFDLDIGPALQMRA